MDKPFKLSFIHSGQFKVTHTFISLHGQQINASIFFLWGTNALNTQCLESYLKKKYLLLKKKAVIFVLDKNKTCVRVCVPLESLAPNSCRTWAGVDVNLPTQNMLSKSVHKETLPNLTNEDKNTASCHLLVSLPISSNLALYLDSREI